MMFKVFTDISEKEIKSNGMQFYNHIIKFKICLLSMFQNSKSWLEGSNIETSVVGSVN